jgi:transposase
MMGRQDRDQRQLFYEFSLDEMIPTDHLLRRINVFASAVLADLHEQLKAFYSDIGRPSVDPELMIRMLLVGYCYGIRHERRLCQEVALHLAYRWFCKLDLDDKVPHHSTFSMKRLGRFRESEILRHIFERVVATCMAAGLVKGEGFAVDASVLEANASRYHGKAPDELDWTDAQRQKRAVAEYLAGLKGEAQVQEGGNSRDGGSDGKPTAAPDRKPPKVISPSDPSSAWTAKANKRVQFGYGLNYLIDVEHAIIVDVEPTPARTYDEVASTKTMIERTEQRLDLKPDWLTADTIPPMGPANCLPGCWAKASRRTSPCGKDIHRLMACSSVTSSRTTLSGTSMSVPIASSCEPRERSTIAASGTTCHNLKTAVLARSSNDARAHRSRRSLATSVKMHATTRGH